jgi:hypothetical protein
LERVTSESATSNNDHANDIPQAATATSNDATNVVDPPEPITDNEDQADENSVLIETLLTALC